MQHQSTPAHQFKPGDLAVILPLDDFDSDYTGTVCEILSEPFSAAYATEGADGAGTIYLVRHADGAQRLMFGQEHAMLADWLVYVPAVSGRERPPEQSRESLQHMHKMEGARLRVLGVKHRGGLTVKDIWGPECPMYFVA